MNVKVHASFFKLAGLHSDVAGSGVTASGAQSNLLFVNKVSSAKPGFAKDSYLQVHFTSGHRRQWHRDFAGSVVYVTSSSRPTVAKLWDIRRFLRSQLPTLGAKQKRCCDSQSCLPRSLPRTTCQALLTRLHTIGAKPNAGPRLRRRDLSTQQRHPCQEIGCLGLGST